MLAGFSRNSTYAAVAILLLMFFSYLMLEITLRYIPFSSTASFLQIKQTEVNSISAYIYIFYVHVYTSMFCLLAGFTQFNKSILKNAKQLHRNLGYLYILVVLVFSAPSGLLMGTVANGGVIGILFFVVLAVLWWWFTFKALLYARDKKFIAHRNMMIRSYALALSAITLRIWKYLLAQWFALPPMDIYIMVAGLGWVPNLLIAEFIIYKKRKK